MTHCADIRRIVVAFDSFKGSLSSRDAGEAFRRGVHAVYPDIDVDVVAIADGGEGMVEAIVEGVGAEVVEAHVIDPLGRGITARYALLHDASTAVIAMSAASGLMLLGDQERDPLHATTYGTGELIMDALRRGVKHIIVGLGGSATNDGGAGMLRALGYRFLNVEGEELRDTLAILEGLHSVDASLRTPLLDGVTLVAAVDVDNPLCGAEGASHVFAPQKGASPCDVERLDAALSHYASVIDAMQGDAYSLLAGAGAAGGVGYAVSALLGAPLRRGIDIVLECIGFDSLLCGADIVVTGEGAMDAQTLHGKAPMGVLRMARTKGIAVIGVGGRIVDAERLLEGGFSRLYAITPATMPLSEAMLPDVAKRNMEAAARRIAEEL